MFLEFADDLDNLTGGLSSVGDNSNEFNNVRSSSQPPATPTPKRRAHSQLLEFEHDIAANGHISMTIVPGAEKPIFPHVVRFSQEIGHELVEQRGESVDCVELFQEIHVRVETFVSQGVEDAYNQMLKLQSQPTPEGSQPLSRDKICDHVLDRRYGYSKGLSWGSKPKARKTTSASSSSTSCTQST
ncbi:CACTA en-spm transposon protein [Cucumis melo var. makuwa]|uniref:CACTA en-spm transposon protein n=1 Tax=Cucumis melo var. makuwa TaxID=1194695 RepID=A0A5D3DU66_CUCMM|nr:CACTA en-spm transposon protein [Cucumis melo var. makuwa]TYK27052.1 CACTA en-spm transposon protein [Cucumis melo var. makuwa]